ncbi:MAG TPA: class I SAM-dependent methyltransferase [Candidatus Limnocylindrales bacterium]|nr:class I SAM-dependent methyltransferase [Candidatus Limnocylindrales bacterium]
MSVTITDASPRRIIEITGEQRGFGGVVQYSRIETHYSRETLEALLAAKGETWLRDEIARAEEPSYIEEPLRRQFERFVPVAGQRVLDFGCGCGASTLCLARLGAASVSGVEPNAVFAAAARLRVRDSGLADRVGIRHVTDTCALPFEDSSFDAVIMNAVLEHIPPAARRGHLHEIWRVIAPNGHLFIGETPNQLWPQDFHTTGLWLVPYMPLRLARRYAILRKRVPPEATINWLLSEGIRGSGYWEVMAALQPDVRCLNLVKCDDVDWFWARSLARPGQTPTRLKIKHMLRAIHEAVAHGVLHPLGIPAVAFLPDLSLCLEKTHI